MADGKICGRPNDPPIRMHSRKKYLGKKYPRYIITFGREWGEKTRWERINDRGSLVDTVYGI